MTKKASLILTLVLGLLAGIAPQAKAEPPEKAQPILTVDQVKVGMKGYGMTVFHGTTIEPFAVEVLTINANETPNRAVIWVRCTDERMIHTGPVQGMSGSPIYLWEEGEEQVPGKGGKLIGAFAFGYGNTNECVAGIQPIEYMRGVGERATADDRPALAWTAPHGAGLATMTRLSRSAEVLGLPALTRARLEVARGMMQTITPGAERFKLEDFEQSLPAGPGGEGRAMRMSVPMAVGSDAVAQMLSPTMLPLGIRPFAADAGAMGGKAPTGFDVDDVKLEPGSALVVPFAWGDADLSGAGTVTDVLPDGTVLGFGHAMDGVGVTAIPMATGYVHFIVSLNTISYKRSGSLELKGALVQDEQAAVAGTSATPYKTAPVKVAVNIEGQPKREYNYTMANHPMLTGPIAGAVVAQSTTSVQLPPMRHTTRYTTKLKFSGGHELNFASAMVGSGDAAAAGEIAGVVSMLTQNPFEEVTLESVESAIDIEYGIDAFEIMSAKLDRNTAAPGETVTATLELAGLFEKPTTKTIKIQIPDDMPEGDTQVMLADAASYSQIMLMGKPWLNQIDEVSELVSGIQEVFSTDPTKLYAVLPTRKMSVALDGQDLPNLPSSLAVVIAGNNPKAQVYQSMQTTEHDMGRIVMGQVSLQLKVQRSRGSR